MAAAIRKLSLERALSRFAETWSPRVVARVNDCHVKLAKLDGEFVWHAHANEDELFLVLKGRLRLRFRDGELTLGPGELAVVPRGIEHCPVADADTHVLLLEPASTVNTGDAGGARTREAVWIEPEAE